MQEKRRVVFRVPASKAEKRPNLLSPFAFFLLALLFKIFHARSICSLHCVVQMRDDCHFMALVVHTAW